MKIVVKNIESLIDKWNLDLIRDYNWCWSNSGYLQVWIDGRLQSLHQIIVKRMGLDPSKQVDHIDGNPLNNHESNLREATVSQNAMNRKKQSNNTSGYVGVSWHAGTNKWQTSIKVNSKRIHLGLFDDKIEAAKTRDKAALKYHGEFARLNFPELKLNYYLSFLFQS